MKPSILNRLDRVACATSVATVGLEGKLRPHLGWPDLGAFLK